MIKAEIQSETLCYHCGNNTKETLYTLDEKQFCCIGCKSVYQILSSNNLCDYYAYNDSPGQKQKYGLQQFAYLDEESIAKDLVDYMDENIIKVTFYIPSIHCSSCIWLLEHLYKLDSGVVHSRIDFLKKQVSVTFKRQEISLRKVVELLASVGYEPLISLQDVVKEKQGSVNRSLILRIAVAGLCMGNVMLFSFPEYLGLSAFEQHFKALFGWLNLVFAIPATFYCGWPFFSSAWAGLRNKMINLDAPLALIIAVLFLRTAFEVVSNTGAGFADTLTGLVFLLLMGRWVKQRSYYHLSFERDYRSYFPVSVTVLKDAVEKPSAIGELKVGDRVVMHNNEILPADSILMKSEAQFDFSFVTGESEPVEKVAGEIVYAGGRLVGEATELEVIKPVSQSYLTNLWNNENFNDGNAAKTFNDTVAQYFSLVSFSIAIAAAAYWLSLADSHKAWTAFTAVLIVACPCVLSLSTPFILSAVLGIFDKHEFFLKNTDTVERLAKTDTLVFDKTGTITTAEADEISFTGKLTMEERIFVASLARNSMHPLSVQILKWLKTTDFLQVSDYREIAGQGIQGIINQQQVMLGSTSFINQRRNAKDSSGVYLMINGEYKGHFKINQHWRDGIHAFFSSLTGKADLHLLSGDNENDRSSLFSFFPRPLQMHFNQTPFQKLNYIKQLQQKEKTVTMLGDGLNDAGALKQSDVGIAITDNINNFSPACDAILQGTALNKLPQFIKMAKKAVLTIKMSFVISSAYNVVGLYYAVQGNLSPLTAAVLMPISTVTIIAFTTLCTRFFSFKNQLK